MGHYCMLVGGRGISRFRRFRSFWTPRGWFLLRENWLTTSSSSSSVPNFRLICHFWSKDTHTRWGDNLPARKCGNHHHDDWKWSCPWDNANLKDTQGREAYLFGGECVPCLEYDIKTLGVEWLGRLDGYEDIIETCPMLDRRWEDDDPIWIGW